MQIQNRNWVEISLTALAANIAMVRQRVPGELDLMAILKADAYGHGASTCAKAVSDAGIDWIGVSTASEGMAIRKRCPGAQILLLSHYDSNCDEIFASRLVTQIGDESQLDLLVEGWSNSSRSQAVPIHIELDTGLARQGVSGEAKLRELLGKCLSHPFLKITGVSTHFLSPETVEPDRSLVQLEQMARQLDVFRELDIELLNIHAGCTATAFVPSQLEALCAMAKKHGARPMLRCGMALFGHLPRYSPGAQVELPRLVPILSWRTRIVAVRSVEVGAGVGYDWTFVAARPSRIALVPVGFADGLSRQLSNVGQAIVRGCRVRYAGRISMELAMLDVTDLDEVTIGDEVVIIGSQGEETVSADELADLNSTIPEEITCAIGPRVARVYTG